MITSYSISPIPNEPEYRHKFVLTADGYYGDLSETFRLHHFDTPPETLFGNEISESLRSLFDAYDLLDKLWNESSLQYDVFEGHPLYDHPGRELVFLDEGNHFPALGSFELTYYNKDGIPFNVELITS